jgi:sugar phosphate isomerase/epimerase
MDSITRRNFLAGLAATTAGASLLACPATLFGFATHPEPHIEFPFAPRDRIAVASWPFRAYIDSPTNDDRKPGVPGMDLKDFAAHISSKFNVRNIEPYNWHFSSTDPKYLHDFRASLQKANAKAINIAVDGEESYYDPDPATRKKAVDFARKWIDIAVAIGAPSIRTHVARAKNSAPDLQRTADSLRQVAEYAAQKNVVANLENDDPVSEDPFFLVKVIAQVDNPYLRALPDFANSMQGGDADFNYRAVEAMFRHAYSICHIKDGETPASRKPFTIDLAKTFGILKSSGYRGYCSIEFDGQSDPHEPTAKLIDATIRFLK